MTMWKRFLSCFFAICILCSVAACSNTGSSTYPAYYDALCNTIGKSADAALEVLKTSDSGVTPDQFGAYQVPVQINFQGVSFDTVGLGFYEDALFSFSYSAVFNEDSNSKATGTSALALHLRQVMGKSREEQTQDADKKMGLDKGEPSFEEVFSVEYLTQWFSEKTNDMMTYTWVVGDLATDSAKSLYNTMLKTARHEKEKYHENLALQMTFTVRKHEDGSAKMILGFKTYLYYGSEFKTSQSS